MAHLVARRDPAIDVQVFALALHPWLPVVLRGVDDVETGKLMDLYARLHLETHRSVRVGRRKTRATSGYQGSQNSRRRHGASLGRSLSGVCFGLLVVGLVVLADEPAVLVCLLFVVGLVVLADEPDVLVCLLSVLSFFPMNRLFRFACCRSRRSCRRTGCFGLPVVVLADEPAVLVCLLSVSSFLPMNRL